MQVKFRKANAKEIEAYKQLQLNSINYQTLYTEALAFYKNGANWHGLEENCKRHREACKAWDVELAAAGFRIGNTGLRVQVKPRSVKA